MSKLGLNDRQTSSTLQLAKTAKEALVFSKKREWEAPSENSKTSVTLDYLASFHSSP